MAKFINSAGKKVRIDMGNNVFLNNKCMNTFKDKLPTDWQGWNQKMVLDGVEDGQLTPYEDKVVVTGHVPSFSYGSNPDNDGKPYKVETGHEAW
jgi:hypothetical protein